MGHIVKGGIYLGKLHFHRAADDGIRTRDLRFTKPLLYQLSYVGTSGQTLHRGKAAARRALLSCS
jgi:hypothetical protein